MTDFRIGDRVIFIAPHLPSLDGARGRIIGLVASSTAPYNVELDGGQHVAGGPSLRHDLATLQWAPLHWLETVNRGRGEDIHIGALRKLAADRLVTWSENEPVRLTLEGIEELNALRARVGWVVDDEAAQ